MAATTVQTEQQTAVTSPKKLVEISSSDLRLHNTPDDLWISIQGKVYDVTKWIPSHPGGDLPIMNLAGQDVTDAFVAFHPPAAWAHLDRFHIGHLTDYTVSPVSKDYRRLVSEFSKLGLFTKKAHVTAFTLAAMLLLFAASVSLVLLTSSPLLHALAAALMGAFWIQSGWIGHDSGHYVVMTDRFYNRFAQVVSGNCLAGISIAWWKRNHNAHHVACNSLNFDPDLQHMPFFAVSTELFRSIRSFFYDRKMTFDPVSRFLISYQHFTFYPVMCLARINLFAQSIILLLSNKNVHSRVQEIIGVGIFWLWFPLLVSCLPTWSERMTFVAVSFAVTGIQHVQFCLNHFTSEVYLGAPKGNDWFEKQTAGTMDITCPSWMDWFHGGLQFQVEHHLFPRLPRCHLRRVSPFVKELCKKHNLTYRSESFYDANKVTLKTLRAAALQARENLVWEAVNHHG